MSSKRVPINISEKWMLLHLYSIFSLGLVIVQTKKRRTNPITRKNIKNYTSDAPLAPSLSLGSSVSNLKRGKSSRSLSQIQKMKQIECWQQQREPNSFMHSRQSNIAMYVGDEVHMRHKVDCEAFIRRITGKEIMGNCRKL